jgi:hypothetical protein
MFPNLKVWDNAKIMSLFPVNVASSITDIPLLDDIVEDKLIWVDSLYGEYKVRSGYNMILNVIGRVVADVNHDGWNCLWRIHAPPRLNTYCGVYAKTVSLHGQGYKREVSTAPWCVHFVMRLLKMIGI